MVASDADWLAFLKAALAFLTFFLAFLTFAALPDFFAFLSALLAFLRPFFAFFCCFFALASCKFAALRSASAAVQAALGPSLTVKLVLAAAPVFEAWSVALTWIVWEPAARPEPAFGELQAAKAPASRRHSKLEPASSAAKAALAEVVVRIDPWDGDVIVTLGAVVSTVKVPVAGLGSWLSTAPSALKAAVWGPSLRPVKVLREVQSA